MKGKKWIWISRPKLINLHLRYKIREINSFIEILKRELEV